MLRSGNSAVLIAGYVVDAFFFLDIFVNFLTSYPESATEEIVTNHRRIAIHYLKTWFAVDFIAVIPFDWFVDEIRPESEDVSLANISNASSIVLKFFQSLFLSLLGSYSSILLDNIRALVHVHLFR